MKIVSKFKDYYDNVQGLAFDDSLLFVRQPLELKRGMPDFERYARVLSGLSNFARDLTCVEVLFCGVKYRGLCHSAASQSLHHYENKRDVLRRFENQYYWTLDGFMKSELANRLVEDRYEKGRWRSDGPKIAPSRIKGQDNETYGKRLHKVLADLFTPLKLLEYSTFAIQNRCPVFIREGSHFDHVFTVNGNLGSVGFQKVMPPHQAYQELSMFLANLTSPERPIVQIEDKYKIAEHGFNEWTFRKQPANFKG